MVSISFHRVCLALIAFFMAAPTASAAPSRRIAVLEYRSGATAIPRLGYKMAQKLGKLTAHEVISPADAQRSLGSGIDAEVAACQGSASCIARIGARLRCDEVLLVGISQLGDVILAIQRIQVRSGRVLARLADSMSRRRRLRSSKLSGYLRKLLPAAEFKRYGRIVVSSGSVGDKVFVDELSRGSTPLGPIKVPAPGRYAVRVKRAGHLDFVARLDVLPEATVEVKPTLTPIGSGRRRWYQRWWVWALVGGAVAAATTATIISATSSPSDVQVDVVWPGR
jgi:hypothetical protein